MGMGIWLHSGRWIGSVQRSGKLAAVNIQSPYKPAWPGRDDERGLELFFECLFEDFDPEHSFRIHFFELGILFFQCL
jgi:hypothetical protein